MKFSALFGADSAQPMGVADQVASWVKRARLGDQIAQAALLNVGEKARAGDKRFVPYYNAALALVGKKKSSSFGGESGAPVTSRWWWPFGRKKKALALPAAGFGGDIVVRVDPSGLADAADPEAGKPEVPQGAFDKLLDPGSFQDVIVEASCYRHGLDGAAAVIACGPLLDDACINGICSAHWQGAAADTFVYGVQCCGEADPKVGKVLDAQAKRALVVGQCIGRARRIQLFRTPSAKLGGVIGWELGE